MKKNKIFLSGLVVIVVLGLAYSAYEYNKYRLEIHEKEIATRNFSGIAELCLNEFPAKNSHEKTRNLRHCVFINSQHNTEKNMRSLWEKADVMSGWMLGYMRKEKPYAPPMECSVRSGMLTEILKSQGLQSRHVVATRNEDNFNDHVVVEVLNPETGEWELHDPSYDVEFLSLTDKRPLGIKEMLSSGTGKFVPCNHDSKCGWDLKTREGTTLDYNRGYWDIAWVKTIRTLFTTDRLDVNVKRYVQGQKLSYCEFRAKWCKDKIEAVN